MAAVDCPQSHGSFDSWFIRRRRKVRSHASRSQWGLCYCTRSYALTLFWPRTGWGSEFRRLVPRVWVWITAPCFPRKSAFLPLLAMVRADYSHMWMQHCPMFWASSTPTEEGYCGRQNGPSISQYHLHSRCIHTSKSGKHTRLLLYPAKVVRRVLWHKTSTNSLWISSDRLGSESAICVLCIGIQFKKTRETEAVFGHPGKHQSFKDKTCREDEKQEYFVGETTCYKFKNGNGDTFAWWIFCFSFLFSARISAVSFSFVIQFLSFLWIKNNESMRTLWIRPQCSALE